MLWRGRRGSSSTRSASAGCFFATAGLPPLITALSFVNIHDCSLEANSFNFNILVLRVLFAFAAGHGRFVDGLFRRIYSNIHVHKDCDGIRQVLLSMRSDITKSSILYRRLKPKAVDGIMDLVAKCPELKGKMRLARRTFDPAYNMSLRPRLWQHSTRHTTSSIPAYIIALSFVQKRHPQLSYKMKNSGMKQSINHDAPVSSKDCDLRKGTERLHTPEVFAEDGEASS